MKIFPKNSPINTKLVIIGLFFFINPNISVFDIFPDFIGASLIVAGILHLSDIDNRVLEAKNKLTILAFVDLLKLLTVFMLFRSKGTVWGLIFSLCFGVGEALLFIYSMYQLYQGITYRALRAASKPMYTKCQSVFPMTLIFTLVKSILSILPEFTSLNTDYGFIDAFTGNKEQLIGFINLSLTALNLLVVFAYGFGWWMYLRKYFKNLSKEKDFLQGLQDSYIRDVASHHEVMTYRALKTAGMLFSAGVFFLIPLKLSGNDLLPDYFAALLLILAVCRLYRLYEKPCKQTLFAGGIYAVFSLAEWFYELFFNKTLLIDEAEGYFESASAILKYHPEHLPAYYGLCTVSITKYLSLFLFLFMISRIFLPIIKEHTGSAFDSMDKTKQIQKELLQKRRLLIGCAALATFTGIFYRLFRMFSHLMIVQYVDLVGVGILLLVLIYFLTKLGEAIDNKYYCERTL